jgi:starvation-inducible DNA-binding protein
MLYNSSVDLPLSTRENLVDLLNARVGLLTDLYTQTKLAHWNVRGPHFIAYHELFDGIAGRILDAQDALAERAAQLGGAAGQTIQQVAASTSVEAWPMETRQGSDVIHGLGQRLEHVANLIRADIDRATQLKDADTADLFTEVSRQLDKDLWFVEAHYTA